jgi:cytidylate kinase
MIIAIDGPSASGKSTVSKTVAEQLGYGYLDTGAMYRAVALRALKAGVDVDDADALGPLADEADIAFAGEGPLPSTVLLDGEDVTSAIRLPDVTHAVSPVSKVPAVREAMMRAQRAIASVGEWVVEGRDIGTVVFPDADVKVFLTASVAERARRRTGDFKVAGVEVGEAEVAETLERRDRIDSTRDAAPLARATDAHEIDTTELSVDEVVARVVELAREPSPRMSRES